MRAVSDTVDRELPADVDYLVRRTTTAARIGATAGTLFRRPSIIKDLWQLKVDALLASERLGKYLVGVIEQLA